MAFDGPAFDGPAFDGPNGAAEPTTRLALAAGAGDPVAMDALVRATQADVWRCCAHLVSQDAADDLTQETYLRVVRALRSFRGDSSGRTFVLAIARRACADEIRKRTRRRGLTERLRQRYPAGVHDPGATTALDELVADLDPDRRAAFVLTQLIGLSYEEAATVCDCAVGTIRSRVSRARQQLIDALDDAPEWTEDASG
jgi:RNA polymerase sigma-70 factor (ECF subfamily)